MKISMTNVGPLPDTEIKVDGLTVISGQNGTGKSTVLKVLYSVLEASQNLETKKLGDARKNISDLMYRYYPETKVLSFGADCRDFEYIAMLRNRIDEMSSFDRSLLEKIEAIVSGESGESFHNGSLKAAIRDEFIRFGVDIVDPVP